MSEQQPEQVDPQQPETKALTSQEVEYEDFKISSEMRYQQRRMAAEGMVGAMLDLIGDKMSEDQKMLFKEGWVDMMVPEPPSFPANAAFMVPQIQPMPPSTFEYEDSVSITFYDWHCLLQRSSHFVKNKTRGNYDLFKGSELVLSIPAGPAADSFEAYATAAKNRFAAPGMIRG